MSNMFYGDRDYTLLDPKQQQQILEQLAVLLSECKLHFITAIVMMGMDSVPDGFPIEVEKIPLSDREWFALSKLDNATAKPIGLKLDQMIRRLVSAAQSPAPIDNGISIEELGQKAQREIHDTRFKTKPPTK